MCEVPPTMQAAVLRAQHDVAIQSRRRPDPAPHEVLVRVSAVGVCGSDVHYYEHGRIGRFVVDSPLVLGHEASGVIEAVGAAVPESRVGQRVSIEPGVPDLTCPQCLAGRYNLCPDMRFFATPPVDGAFSEYVTVHASFAHPVPDTMSDDAAALIEPLSVGLWACRRGGVTAGSRVLITGAGPIGLVALQAALAMGAAEVAVVDVNPRRLELAASLGAGRTIDARSASVASLDAKPTVLLECTGVASVSQAGIGALDRGGTAVLVGMGADADLPVPVATLQERELTLTGTFRYANTWPSAIALVAGGRIDLDRLVTAHFALDAAEDALQAGRRDPDAVKVVVRPGGA